MSIKQAHTNTAPDMPMDKTIGLIAANVLAQVTDYDKINDLAFPYLVGAPGGGKTACIKALCKRMGWGYLSTHFALKPIEEIGGIPNPCQITITNIDGEKVTISATEWSMPDTIKELYSLSSKYEVVVWILDDMHLMSAIHNSLMYELLTERKLRDFKLPKNCAMVLLGNHGCNKAGAKSMFSAVMNRVMLMPVYTDQEAWKNDFAIPNEMHSAVVSFLDHEINSQYFHMDEQTDSPWCSPRSWSRAANLLKKLEFTNSGKAIASNIVLYIFAGHVGKDAASAFTNYYTIYSKFDIPHILENCDKFTMPEKPVDRYALAYALVSHFSGRSDRKKVVDKVAKIIVEYFRNYEDLALVIAHELIAMSKLIENKDDLFSMVSESLNAIDRGITRKVLMVALSAGKIKQNAIDDVKKEIS